MQRVAGAVLRSALPKATPRVSYSTQLFDNEQMIISKSDPGTQVKSLDSFVQSKKHTQVAVLEQTPQDEAAEVSGVQEFVQPRHVRIFRPAKEAAQSGWQNTKFWRIEFDNKERWENPLMGWASNSDPLSNISGHLKFTTEEDAIRFCEKNRWRYEVLEPQIRSITHKTYAANFSWDKRTRTGMK